MKVESIHLNLIDRVLRGLEVYISGDLCIFKQPTRPN